MTSIDDVGKTILRNKLLGRWAADRLGITGQEADAYSDDLARGTIDPKRCDVFSKIRKDFDDAGVDVSDERILGVMTELTIKAGNLMPSAQGGASDAAEVTLKRNLMSR